MSKSSKAIDDFIAHYGSDGDNDDYDDGLNTEISEDEPEVDSENYESEDEEASNNTQSDYSAWYVVGVFVFSLIAALVTTFSIVPEGSEDGMYFGIFLGMLIAWVFCSILCAFAIRSAIKIKKAKERYQNLKLTFPKATLVVESFHLGKEDRPRIILVSDKAIEIIDEMKKSNSKVIKWTELKNMRVTTSEDWRDELRAMTPVAVGYLEGMGWYAGSRYFDTIEIVTKKNKQLAYVGHGTITSDKEERKKIINQLKDIVLDKFNPEEI